MTAPSSSPTARRARSLALDVLRGVAVLLVIGRHALLPLDGASPALQWVMSVWQRGGWAGVDLFFVLSGFLVSGLLFREWQRTGSLRVGRFLLRRAMKIYPAFYVLLFFTVVQTGLRRGWHEIAPSHLLAEALFVQNYWQGLFQQTWSLAVEEHFYLLCAALLVALSRGAAGRSPFRHVPALTLLVGVGCLGARALTAWSGPFTYLTHLYPTHLRLDALMFGVCLSYWFHFDRERLSAWVGRWRLSLLGAGFLLVLPVFCISVEAPVVHTVGLTSVFVGSGLIVLVAAERDIRPTPLVRVTAFVGASSYSVYLWHSFAQRAAEHVAGRLGFTRESPLTFGLYLVGSLAGGVLMARLVEVPVLALRDHWLVMPSSNEEAGRRPRVS
jgi:peptidoglycan/LPS O-acetylase OafA/YrhL